MGGHCIVNSAEVAERFWSARNLYSSALGTVTGLHTDQRCSGAAVESK